MPIGAYLTQHTHRQHLAWLAWLTAQWDLPSRSDVYLMQVATEVRRTVSKQPRSVHIKHFQLKFGENIGTKLSREQAAAISKAKWVGMMTMPVKVVSAD